jgi:uncharacterized lipoprotein YbaY
VTGSLTYAEPAKLSADATAIAVLVKGNAKPTEETIVASQLIAPAGQIPVEFDLEYEAGIIDAAATYTVQAAIIDGAHAWATSNGVPVVTKGNPSEGLVVKLAYRPDLVKGQVTGGITGVGIELSTGTYAAAVLVRPDTGESLGISFDPAPASVPIPFSIPFDPATIDSGADYVVKAAVVAGERRWENSAGVPVITNGNQLTGVTVTVTEAVEPAPTPEPTPEPSPTPAPSPAPGPGDDGSGNTGLLVLLGLVVAAVVGIGAFLAGRRSGGSGPAPHGGASAGEPGPEAGMSQAGAAPGDAAAGEPVAGTAAGEVAAEEPVAGAPAIEAAVDGEAPGVAAGIAAEGEAPGVAAGEAAAPGAPAGRDGPPTGPGEDVAGPTAG